MASVAREWSLQQADTEAQDLNLRRVLRALEARKRYRYVSPNVVPIINGYRIESPCCSRNVDAEGGVIDVALILYDAEETRWRLLRKDHANNVWIHDSAFHRLDVLLRRLSEDPERSFWQ